MCPVVTAICTPDGSIWMASRSGIGSKGRFGCAGSRFRRGRDCGEVLVLQEQLGPFAHLPVRVSAATDFFKASMMLMTLLGAGAEASVGTEHEVVAAATQEQKVIELLDGNRLRVLCCRMKN